jgi:hypothetical protein
MKALLSRFLPEDFMRRVSLFALSLLAVLSACLWRWHAPSSARHRNQSTNSNVAQQRQTALAAYEKLPLRFEASRDGTSFIARSNAYRAALHPNEMALHLHNSPAVLRMQLTGASAPIRWQAAEVLPGHSNYLTGNDAKQWRTNVTGYARVQAAQVYPGIDVVWHGRARQLEYDFLVAPHAQPERIRMRWSGAQSIRLTATGELELRAGQATEPLRLLKPEAWQEVNGQRVKVTCDYHLLSRQTIGLRFLLFRPLSSDALIFRKRPDFKCWLMPYEDDQKVVSE